MEMTRVCFSFYNRLIYKRQIDLISNFFSVIKLSTIFFSDCFPTGKLLKKVVDNLITEKKLEMRSICLL